MIGLNTMIGAGIFTLPSKLGALAGPAGLVTFILGFLGIWFIAQSFARAAYLYPQEGSFYIYAKQWGGHMMGLISAGAYMFGLLFALGLLCQITGNYLHSALGISKCSNAWINCIRRGSCFKYAWRKTFSSWPICFACINRNSLNNYYCYVFKQS